MREKKRQIGLEAVRNKTGVHALSTDQIKENSKKGNLTFLEKWSNEEYRDIHAKKIKLGRLSRRLEKIGKALEHQKPWILKGF